MSCASALRLGLRDNIGGPAGRISILLAACELIGANLFGAQLAAVLHVADCENRSLQNQQDQ